MGKRKGPNPRSKALIVSIPQGKKKKKSEQAPQIQEQVLIDSEDDDSDSTVFQSQSQKQVGELVVPASQKSSPSSSQQKSAHSSQIPDISEDVGDSDVEKQQHSKKKRNTRKEPVILDEKVEDDLVEWIKNSPMFYDKSLNSYKCVKHKKDLWAKKAEEVGLDPDQLDTWYKTARTAYGKLTKTKSGQGAEKHTERENWFLTKFEFLRNHITRVASRQGCSVST